MKKIYKYTIHQEIQALDIPKNSIILSVQNQNNKICLWALVDTDERIERRFFMPIATGQDIDFNIDIDLYIGTIQIEQFIWHIFEIN